MWSFPRIIFGMSLLVALDRPVTKEELRFAYVMEQDQDSSCGLASVASALSLYWQVPVDETALLAWLFNRGGSPGLEAKGRISLASMAAIFEGWGVSARAFWLDWSGLAEVLALGYAPMVVHYNRPDPHFALLLGITGETAVVADPARGLESVSKGVFEKRYSGVALVLASRTRRRDLARLESAIRTALRRRALLDKAGAFSRIPQGRFK